MPLPDHFALSYVRIKARMEGVRPPEASISASVAGLAFQAAQSSRTHLWRSCRARAATHSACVSICGRDSALRGVTLRRETPDGRRREQYKTKARDAAERRTTATRPVPH